MPRITSSMSSTCASTLHAVITLAGPWSARIRLASRSSKNAWYAASALMRFDLAGRLHPDRPAALELTKQGAVVRADVDHEVLADEPLDPGGHLPRKIGEVVMQRLRVAGLVRVVQREHQPRLHHDRQLPKPTLRAVQKLERIARLTHPRLVEVRHPARGGLRAEVEHRCGGWCCRTGRTR